MRFAHFAHLWGKQGMTPGQRYEQLWKELQLADELGFDYGFSVEHHFTPQESWMSSPALYAVAGSARAAKDAGIDRHGLTGGRPGEKLQHHR